MFRNSDDLVDFIWYPALPDAPVLPYPSLFTDPVWDDWDYEHEGVGLVTTPNIKNNWKKVIPKALAKHICGERIDFGEGGYYDPLAPPVPYRPDGLPSCCGPADPDAGGMGMGGHVIPLIIPPAPPFNPGNTCATAGVANVDQLYTFTSSSIGSQWIKLNRSPGAFFGHLLCQYDDGSVPKQINKFGGPDCPGLVFQTALQTNFVFTVVFGPTDVGFFQIFVGDGVSKMHFQVTTGYPDWSIYPHGGMAMGGKVTPTVTP